MSNVKSAYKKLGKTSFYDGMITSTTFLGSLVNRIVWRMNKAENREYLEKTLSPIPADFCGKLLDELVIEMIRCDFRLFVTLYQKHVLSLLSNTVWCAEGFIFLSAMRYAACGNISEGCIQLFSHTLITKRPVP